jgi:hypothetical protein
VEGLCSLRNLHGNGTITSFYYLVVSGNSFIDLNNFVSVIIVVVLLLYSVGIFVHLRRKKRGGGGCGCYSAKYT